MKSGIYIKTVKYFLYSGFLILLLSFSQFFAGCGGSKDDNLAERERRRDSITVYTKLDKAFLLYKRALSYNESFEDESAKNAFDGALRELNTIDEEVLDAAGNYVWKRDYEELSKSIVEDYLTTQKEILESSLVFKFADRINLVYEKVKQYETNEREPLPNGGEIKLIRNSVVDEYIDFFSKTDRGRKFIDKTLYRSGKYFPLMRKILKFHNAPEELIYLSVQESGLSPTIVSRAGAVGLWQFMPATGYAYGLYQDGYRDDRRDFEKSTDAAARHLKDLYRSLGDWYLAFAAYNAGPGRVTGAIRKSGSNDFWILRSYLPGETKNYVPSILALSFIFREPDIYGFNNIEYGTPISFDRVNIKASLNLQQIADLSESDIETIRDLNPELTSDNLPLYEVPYQLRIPHNSYKKFAENFKNSNSIDKSYMSSPEFAGNESVEYGKTLAGIEYVIPSYKPQDVRTIGSSAGKTKLTYTFKEKDILSSVAVQYSVRATDLRIWNNIPYGTYPKPNQQLSVFISSANSDYGSNDSKQEVQDTESKNIAGNEESTVETVNNTDNSNSRTFKRFNNNSNNSEAKNTNKEYPTLSSQTGSNTNKTGSTTTVDHDNKNLTYKSDTKKETVSKTKTETKSETKKETTKTEKKSNTGLFTYTVKEGDYLSAIASDYSVKVNDIIEWNNLNDDKILIGQKLKIYTDPSLYKPTSSSNKSTIATHIVSTGEHLTYIAEMYNVSVQDLMEWNNLNDDKIFTGQKLQVKGGKTKTKSTTSNKKVYVVKSGDILTDIARDNGVSVNDLMRWNGLTDDKILVGQQLKLYEDSAVKNNTSKNQTGTRQKQRKRKN